MSTFRRPVTVSRRGSGSYSQGRWTGETEALSFEILASVQPAGPNDVESLPEGRRNAKAFRLYTDTELLDVTSQNPDRVSLFGEDYEVTVKEPWQNNVIDHYKYVVTKIAEA